MKTRGYPGRSFYVRPFDLQSRPVKAACSRYFSTVLWSLSVTPAALQTCAVNCGIAVSVKCAGS